MKRKRIDIKRIFNIKQRLKARSSKMATRALLASTILLGGQFVGYLPTTFTSSENVAEAAGVGSIDIFTNASFDNTGAKDSDGYAVPNAGDPITYDLAFTLEASQQVQGKVLSNQKGVFLVPSDWNVTEDNVFAFITSEIAPFTLSDIPGVTAVVNTVTGVASSTVTLASSALNLVFTPLDAILNLIGLNGDLKAAKDAVASALQNVVTAINTLATEAIKLGDFKDYADDITITETADGTLITVDYKEGLANHIATGFNNTLANLVDGVQDAINAVNIALNVLQSVIPQPPTLPTIPNTGFLGAPNPLDPQYVADMAYYTATAGVLTTFHNTFDALQTAIVTGGSVVGIQLPGLSGIVNTLGTGINKALNDVGSIVDFVVSGSAFGGVKIDLAIDDMADPDPDKDGKGRNDIVKGSITDGDVIDINIFSNASPYLDAPVNFKDVDTEAP